MAEEPAGAIASRSEAIAYARLLEEWGREREWRGSDPYDALNAQLPGLGPVKRRPLGRRLLTQAVKRSPLDLRPLLRVPPGSSPAALAWIASAYARGGFLDPETATARLRQTLQTLEARRCPGYREPCWGYHFDVQSRVFFYSSRTPNTIATAFAGHALLDAHAKLGDEQLLERARAVGEFFLHHVPQVADAPGAYFGYLPGDRSPIHNSSLLVASLLARLSAAGGAEESTEAATAAVRYATSRQRSDGSWPYGERPGLDWVDNFHSGYVLDALRVCADAGIATAEAEAAWQRGIAHYRRELFCADGTPKYYPHEIYPIDAQCVAQGIQTLALAAPFEPAAGEQAWRVLGFALRSMRRRDGLPLFQRRRHWSNRAVHPRWVVAPLLLALTHLLATPERPAEAVVAEHGTEGH